MRDGFLPARRPKEFAERLCRKASEDALAMRELAANPEIADSIVGFHAQQAVEKWLKSIIALRGLPQVRTHDLGRLADIVEADGAQVPGPRDRIDEFTQYAVPLRYEDLLDTEPLDRPSVCEFVDSIGRWATEALEADPA